MSKDEKEKDYLHPLYTTWYCMKNRCVSPKHKNYDIYGGKGVVVCDRWMVFKNFIADMGDKPSPKHTLDRIDSNGNYEPSNCRWASPKVQGQNTSRVKIVEINGEKKCFAEWCRTFGINKATAKARLKAGKTLIEALTTPVMYDARSNVWKKKYR